MRPDQVYERSVIERVLGADVNDVELMNRAIRERRDMAAPGLTDSMRVLHATFSDVGLQIEEGADAATGQIDTMIESALGVISGYYEYSNKLEFASHDSEVQSMLAVAFCMTLWAGGSLMARSDRSHALAPTEEHALESIKQALLPMFDVDSVDDIATYHFVIGYSEMIGPSLDVSPFDEFRELNAELDLVFGKVT